MKEMLKKIDSRRLALAYLVAIFVGAILGLLHVGFIILIIAIAILTIWFIPFYKDKGDK
jgi:uncharacterized membrane protein